MVGIPDPRGEEEDHQEDAEAPDEKRLERLRRLAVPGAFGTSSGGQRRPPKRKPIKDTFTKPPAAMKFPVEASKKGSLKPKTKKPVKMPQARKARINPYHAIPESLWKKMTPAERRAVGERGTFKT
jgi:hypothetical protein